MKAKYRMTIVVDFSRSENLRGLLNSIIKKAESCMDISDLKHSVRHVNGDNPNEIELALSYSTIKLPKD